MDVSWPYAVMLINPADGSEIPNPVSPSLSKPIIKPPIRVDINNLTIQKSFSRDDSYREKPPERTETDPPRALASLTYQIITVCWSRFEPNYRYKNCVSL